MASRSIEIHLQANADTRPLTRFEGVLKSLSGSVKGLGGVVANVTSKFGSWGEVVGGALRNFMRGGIWGIMITAVQEVWGRWKNAAQEAAAAAEKASKESFDAMQKHIDEYAAAAEKLYSTRRSQISESTKLLNDEIDATKELTKATLELQQAQARKRGDSAAVEALQSQIDAVDRDAAAEKIRIEREAAAQRSAAAKEKQKSELIALQSARSAAQFARAEIEDAVQMARDRAAASAKGEAYVMQSSAGAVVSYGAATDRDREAAAKKAEAEFRASDAFKAMSERAADADKKVKELGESYAKAKKEVAAAAKEEDNLAKRAAALAARQEAASVNAEADKAEAAAKGAEERARAEMKAAQDAAKERDKLDRELHAKRMADLRAEIAAQKDAASALSKTASAAQSEFDRAFAMYRDPTRAANEIAEERDYAADLKRLHRDASRYGGKWRIDELSGLMAKGDTQGVADTLESWRKSKSFTPEVEAMVRASAAERTKTTIEDELRKIEANTADLGGKLEKLISMKG